MNLEDVIDPEYGLQQDSFSEARPRFGDDGQLEVIGWNGRGGSGAKLYILKCHTCAQDSELFGDGVFRGLKGNLVRGQVPCGCSMTPRWSEQQFATLCTRKAVELGYTFTGWAEAFRKSNTKTKLLCEKHGEWGTTNIHALINGGRGCPGCMADATRERSLKPDDVMIATFLASGQFPDGTRFWRSDRLNAQGFATYWHVYCPECDSTGEGVCNTLQQGNRPCLCSPARQQQAYINWIVDNKNQATALKFGIANNAKQRVKDQNRRSTYEVRQYLVYNFPTKKQCLAAERECKQTLECSMLTQEEMPDGWTETTSVLNLARIKAIYEKNGGTLE